MLVFLSLFKCNFQTRYIKYLADPVFVIENRMLCKQNDKMKTGAALVLPLLQTGTSFDVPPVCNSRQNKVMNVALSQLTF